MKPIIRTVVLIESTFLYSLFFFRKPFLRSEKTKRHAHPSGEETVALKFSYFIKGRGRMRVTPARSLSALEAVGKRYPSGQIQGCGHR